MAHRPAWHGGPVPAQHAIRGLHGAVLWDGGSGGTARLLTETLGFRLLGKNQGLFRYVAGDGGPGCCVDMRYIPDLWRGTVGVGTIHHVAFRSRGDTALETVRRALMTARYNPTPAIDHRYFRSVYFKGPGRVLFEIATDGPGFTVDEPVDCLGTQLKLPPWLPELTCTRHPYKSVPPPGDRPCPFEQGHYSSPVCRFGGCRSSRPAVR